ncbi:hypothetical protein [Candidatus Methanarcanum hacksteinii]|uniref:hypothetical protein n=1 Tax=Candidatus Methanarcanum hacksteinii TaxID=2911857 RepID=UPI0037DCE7DA
MDAKNRKTFFAIVAALMMLCVVALPIASVNDDASGDSLIASPGYTEYKETSIDGVFGSLDSMDDSMKSIIEEIFKMLGIDEESLEEFVEMIESFVKDSGLEGAFDWKSMISFKKEFAAVEEINEVKVIKAGETANISEKAGKCANLKFTGEGKYVIEKGGSLLVGMMFKLQGSGTIIEMKEGSLIKFTNTAKGFEVPSDMNIVLNGTYESSIMMEFDGKFTSSSPSMNMGVKAEIFSDLEGTISIGDMKITGVSGRDAELKLDLKIDGSMESVNGTVEASTKFASLEVMDVKDPVKIENFNIGISAKINNADGIGFNCKVGVGVVAPNNASASINAELSGNATFDKEAEKASLKAEAKLNIAAKDNDSEFKIATECNMEGKLENGTITAKLNLKVTELMLPMIEAKGVEMELQLKGSVEDFKDDEISDLIVSSYAKADRIKVTDLKTITVEASNVILTADVANKSPKAVIDVGSLKVYGSTSTAGTIAVSGSDLKITAELENDKTSIEGKKLDMNVAPVTAAECTFVANDFAFEMDDDKYTFVKGSFDLKNLIIGELDVEIQKDAKLNAENFRIMSGSDLLISSENMNINGTFKIYPDCEYKYGGCYVEVDKKSLGLLVVNIKSGSQEFLIEPLEGFKLVEPEDGLAYTVSEEDGYGRFVDAVPTGKLIANGELRPYYLTVNGEKKEVKYKDPIELPEAPEDKDGFKFYAWTDGYNMYYAGDKPKEMPARDVVITELWAEIGQKAEADKKYMISSGSDSIQINGEDLSEAITKLKDKAVDQLEIKSGTSKIAFDDKSAEVLAKFTESGFTVTIKQADNSALDEELTYAVGNGALFSIDVKGGTVPVHEIGGVAKVTVIYDLKEGQNVADLKVFYYKDKDGSVENVDCTAVDLGNGKAEVTMELTHFSDYIVKEQVMEVMSDNDSGDNGMSVGVTAGIIAAVIIAIAVIAFIAVKRKG